MKKFLTFVRKNDYSLKEIDLNISTKNLISKNEKKSKIIPIVDNEVENIRREVFEMERCIFSRKAGIKLEKGRKAGYSAIQFD